MNRGLHSQSLGSSLLCDADCAQPTPAAPGAHASTSVSVTSWSLKPSAAPLLSPWQLALADTLEREEQDAKLAQRAAAAAPSASSFYNPEAWRKAFKSMTRAALFQSNQISVFHDPKAGLNLEQDLRLGCCVRILPRLSVIKAALQKLALRNHRRKANTYDMWESATTPASSTSPWRLADRGVPSRRAHPHAVKDTDRVVPSYQPTPTLWAVSGGNDQEILVFDAFTGRRLMRIIDPKLNVPPTAMVHAPFRGFMNQHLHVVPVNKPQDILRLKESQLINTDYVWVGFADGAIRLFPGDHERLRETDRAAQLRQGELADVVFELPKHHAASIISIVRSPCHHDGEGADYSTRNRLSSAVHYMTAAGTSSANTAASGSSEGKSMGTVGTREHLSLMCTASVDSIVVIWDIRKIYQALEAMRAAHRAETMNAGFTSARSAVSVLLNEVVTIEGAHPLFTLRSSCTMVKVRPLMRLKGGVAGFKSLQWVSTLVTSAGFEQPRDVAELTRDTEESSAPKLLRQRRQHQRLTRYERREEHRKLLQLGEEDMKALEALLDEMMPSLKEEPVQSMRVNLLVAGDSVGTVHIWNLDEELQKNASDTIATARSIRSAANTPRQSPSRLESPGRQSNFSAAQYSTASPSVQLSATTSVRTKDGIQTAAGKLKGLKAKHKKKTPSEASAISKAGAATPMSQKIVSGGSVSGSTLKKTPRSAQKGGGSSLKKPKSANATPSRGSAVKKSAPAASERPTGRLTTLGSTGSGPSYRPATSLRTTTLTASSTAAGAVGTRGASKSTRRAMPVLPGPLSHTEETTATVAGRSSLSTLRSSVSPSRARLSMVVSEPSTDRPGSVVRQSPSRSRQSTTRLSTGRQSTHARGDGEPPLISPSSKRVATPSKSMERTARARANEYLSRASQCRIEFTGGVAITGIAVDLPPVLVRTLRRLPEPVHERVSLLEQPTAEQVLRRKLENDFDTLTEEKALYFAFEQLQMYISVEGTVLNLRCHPRWNLADEDGQELFKIHHSAEGDLQRLAPLYRPLPQQNESKVSGEVTFQGFGVEFQKTLLEAHSQPVTALFLDVARRLVWVARNGGLMSLFSTDTKKVVTRVPHPSADTALGPPNASEWRAQQAAFLRHQDEPLHLERHRETLPYKPAFFREVIPFSTRTQVTMLLVSEAVHTDFIDGSSLSRADIDALGSGELYNSYNAFLKAGAGGLGASGPQSAGVMYDVPSVSANRSETLLEAQRIEGRSDMAVAARRREKRLKEVLDHLRLCRVSAVLVRKAEKEEYEQYGDRISANVSYIVRGIGAYAALPILRRAFHQWHTHNQHFRHEHVMRQQRTARLQRARYLALGLERNCYRQIVVQYFVKFLRWRALRRLEQQDDCLVRLWDRLSGARKQPSAEMMARLWAFRTRQSCWRAWERLVRPAAAAPATARSAQQLGTPHGSLHKLNGGAALVAADGRAGSPLRRTATAKYRMSPFAGTKMSGATRRARADGGPLYYEDNEDTSVDRKEARLGDDESRSEAPTPTFADMQAAAAEQAPCADEETETLLAAFRHVTYVILHSRAAILRFEESEAHAESVLDESWLSIVESAEAGADDQDNPDSRRLSVFRYGLLALLQGLLSTADDVLPNLDNESIADEVVSMLLGIQLCMDYISADADVTLSKVGDRFVAATLFKSLAAEDSPRRSRSLLKSAVPYLTRTATQAPRSLPPSEARDSTSAGHHMSSSHPSRSGSPAAIHGHNAASSALNPLLLSHEDACLCVLEVYARQALEDAESREAIREIVNDRESLDVFISFVSEERPERARSTIRS